MDHGDHAPARCSMHMLFTWDTKDLCVVFPWWHVRGPWSLFFTLLGVVALGMSYELLRHIARKYDESTIGTIRLGSPDGEDRPRSPNNNSTTAKFARRRHIIRAVLYGVQVFYSYLLMLVAMTYQGHVLIAIGIGAALGFYLFHDDKTASTRNMACH